MGGDDHSDVVLINDAVDAVAYLALHAEIRWRLAPVVSAAGLRHDAVAVTFESSGENLQVRLVGPRLDDETKQRLRMRVADALRATHRELAGVPVTYDDTL